VVEAMVQPASGGKAPTSKAMSLNFWRLVAIRLFTLDFMGRGRVYGFAPKGKTVHAESSFGSKMGRS
jgi:hypothetical protein